MMPIWFPATLLQQQRIRLGVEVPLTHFTRVQMVVRELRKTDTVQVMIFYLVMCTLTYSFIGCVFSWRHLVTPNSWKHAALLIGVGACGYGNQFCTLTGLSKAKAASVMSMQYFALVFSQLAGVFLFGELTTPPQAVGMIIIVASMLSYLWYEAKNKARNT